jgi:hypothetical protein
VYEIRFQDNEDVDKRNRNEISKLQHDIQEILRENQIINEENSVNTVRNS